MGNEKKFKNTRISRKNRINFSTMAFTSHKRSFLVSSTPAKPWPHPAICGDDAATASTCSLLFVRQPVPQQSSARVRLLSPHCAENRSWPKEQMKQAQCGQIEALTTRADWMRTVLATLQLHDFRFLLQWLNCRDHVLNVTERSGDQHSTKETRKVLVTW